MNKRLRIIRIENRTRGRIQRVTFIYKAGAGGFPCGLFRAFADVDQLAQQIRRGNDANQLFTIADG